jgi:diguanylate cyclase (GGDEF)-like protein
MQVARTEREAYGVVRAELERSLRGASAVVLNRNAAVGDVAASIMRDSDFVGRYGGEEFVVLLPKTGVEGAVVVAEMLRAAIQAVRVASVDRALSASFGIAVIPDHAGDAGSLLRSADRALYAAKRAGRNRVEVLSAGADA